MVRFGCGSVISGEPVRKWSGWRGNRCRIGAVGAESGAESDGLGVGRVEPDIAVRKRMSLL